jgi:hypothetical protein
MSEAPRLSPPAGARPVSLNPEAILDGIGNQILIHPEPSRRMTQRGDRVRRTAGPKSQNRVGTLPIISRIPDRFPPEDRRIRPETARMSSTCRMTKSGLSKPAVMPAPNFQSALTIQPCGHFGTRTVDSIQNHLNGVHGRIGHFDVTVGSFQCDGSGESDR